MVTNLILFSYVLHSKGGTLKCPYLVYLRQGVLDRSLEVPIFGWRVVCRHFLKVTCGLPVPATWVELPLLDNLQIHGGFPILEMS